LIFVPDGEDDTAPTKLVCPAGDEYKQHLEQAVARAADQGTNLGGEKVKRDGKSWAVVQGDLRSRAVQVPHPKRQGKEGRKKTGKGLESIAPPLGRTPEVSGATGVRKKVELSGLKNKAER